MNRDIIQKVFKNTDNYYLLRSDLISQIEDCMNLAREQEKAINYSQCCVNKDSKEVNNINSDKELIDSYGFEDIQLCGKSNCTRPKLEGNVYCSYHYDVNFG